MGADRWRKLENLYQAALEYDPSERIEFLNQACPDEQLRREVESLLELQRQGDELLENPQWYLRASLAIGTALGPYRITSTIGVGGMGEVYRAHDGKLNRDVAIKTLPYEFARDEERLARLRREARTLASLNHPGIGAIYGLEEIGNGECLVLELVEGEMLCGPLPLMTALDRAIQVAEALEAAHDKGIIHRDLKPSNVKVTQDGRVKVLDFGLAKAIWGTDQTADLPTKPMAKDLDTLGGQIIGTPGYMSPEQASGNSVDKRTDIWAFGCLLYELLSGSRAFEGENAQATIAAVLEREPNWRLLPPKTPASIRELLRRCLQKDASRRPLSMAEIRVELKRARHGFNVWRVAAVGAVTLATAGLGLSLWLRPHSMSPLDRSQWIQLTNFADFAAGPVLSRDGRTLAFFRSPDGFATPGPIYVKKLPNGEAAQITDDPRNKYGLAFSMDGSEVSYTAWDGKANFQWNTYTVPVLGGKPRLVFENAGGLTWLDDQHLLYSEVRTGLHMGIVTSTASRMDRREIYFPDYERRMAHYSYPSPDQKWALLAEMQPEWLPCRVVPLDGSSKGRQVGPPGPCTSAGWSPDGSWMYFAAEVDKAHHLWRQRFPKGEPEQITFGPTEETGLAVAPDGRSLITSVGVTQSAVWLHDSRGEHVVSPEGFAAANYLLLTQPIFSRDGRTLYYLLQRESPGSANEIWRTDLDSKKSEHVVRGFAIREFDITGDERSGELVFSSENPGEPSQLWLAPLDRSAPPKRIARSGEGSPHFGPDGTVWYRYSDGKVNFIGLMKNDGSARRQVTAQPISTVMSSSPNGRWLIAMAPALDAKGIDTIAIPAEFGEKPRVIGRGRYPVAWSRDGSFIYIGLEANDGHTVVIPVSGGDLPKLPVIGIGSGKEASMIPGARLIDGTDISPGPAPSIFAYVKTTTQRNLFRIALR